MSEGGGLSTFTMYQKREVRSEQFKGQKSLGPLTISIEMAYKVIFPKKIISLIFKISGTLIVIKYLQIMTDAFKVLKLALTHPGRTSALLNSIRIANRNR